MFLKEFYVVEIKAAATTTKNKKHKQKDSLSKLDQNKRIGDILKLLR